MSSHIEGAEANPDLELLERAQQGDQQALGQLLERYQPQLFRFAMRMCGDTEDAQDVLQESMLAAARNVEGFRGDSALSTWLYSIARSFCIKQRRRPKHAPATVAPLDNARTAEDPGPDPDRQLAQREMLAAVDSALRTLPDESREVLLLRDVEGLSAQEAADVLQMSVPQLKSRLHRARSKVREALGALRETPADLPAGPQCPDITELYSRFLEDEIDQDLCTRMQQHVDSCPACKQRCDQLKEVLQVCRHIPTPDVPADVQRAVRRALEGVKIE